MKMIRTWLVIVLVGLVDIQEPSTALAHQRVGRNQDGSEGIRLNLRLGKERYHAGEPIRVLSYLQNTSEEKTYYVGRRLGNFFVIETFHYITLRIVDEKGRAVQLGLIGETSIWKRNTPLSEILTQEYLPLGPGMIFGQTDEGNITLQPGRYKVTALYYEVEATQWTDKDRSGIPFPVWTKSLVSNSVTVRVLPR
jgi:hypothetical protein